MSKLVIGKKAILEQFKKDNILSVHAIKNFPEIKNKCDVKNIEYIIHYNDNFFSNINVNHQGIVGYIKNENYIASDYNKFLENIDDTKKRKIILILDSLEDVGNIGAIIRTCDCFDIDGIIYKKDNQFQLDDSKLIKTSQSSIYNMNILKVINLSNTIDKLKDDGYWIISSSLNEESEFLKDIIIPDKIALIVGNEKNGVAKNLLNKSDIIVKIPMYGNAQSLNVSVATGILLYSIKIAS